MTGETETVERGRLVQERLGFSVVRALSGLRFLTQELRPSGCQGFAFSLSALWFAGCRCACRNPTPLRHGTPLHSTPRHSPTPLRHGVCVISCFCETQELRENVKPRLGHVFGRFLRDPGIPFSNAKPRLGHI